MKRVLLTGSTGFVGSRILKEYSGRWQIIAPARSEMQLTDAESIRRILEQAQPEVVIHTAALSSTGYCEEHPEESFAVNVLAAEQIAKGCSALGAKLVFFSSDQVYNGTRQLGAMKETAPLSPVNVYGRHKLEAEQRVLNICPDTVCLRASWMYDWEKPGMKNNTGFWGLLQTVMQKGTPLNLAVREYRGITWVMPVVQAMEKIGHLPGGVYNLGARNHRSTYETGMDCLRILGADREQCGLLKPDAQRWPEFERNLSMNSDLLRRYGVDLGDTVDGFAVFHNALKNEQGGNSV